LPIPDESFFFKHILLIGVIFFFLNFERIMKLSAFYKKEKVNRTIKMELYKEFNFFLIFKRDLALKTLEVLQNGESNQVEFISDKARKQFMRKVRKNTIDLKQISVN